MTLVARSAEGRAKAAWPDVVWDTALLRGLDARARTEIEAAGHLVTLRPGEALFEPGAPADALYVVASGVCTLAGIRRGDEGSAVIRHAAVGDLLGEEAIVTAFSTRLLEARAETEATVAEVPLVVLRRAVGRAGGADLIAKVERTLRRAATLDLLRTTSFTRDLTDPDLELLLDAATHIHVARGEHVYREGDVATAAFVVADGLVQAQTDDDGKPRIEAYLARGDLFGDEELSTLTPRAVSVVASGPTWLVAIPRDAFANAARHASGRLDAVRRLRSDGAVADKALRPGGQTTAHVFRDLYRLRVARSLLVIDQDSCIRCGHCAWSCADVHDDGVSRLVRRGDKIVIDGGAALGREAAPLLVPNSCQHCKNPSCMIDCPTGAIGRDARGEVFIREDLCTGCGSCAKACPWDNIQMAPRPKSAASAGRPNASVAVKCDLCKGEDGGPACVASCPTQSITRIDPNAALAPLRAPSSGGLGREAAAPILPPKTPAWPWTVGAALAGLGLAISPLGRWASGIVSGLLIVLLVGYALGKRIRGPIARLRGQVPLSRWLYVAHLSVGTLGCGVIVSHTRLHASGGAAGALLLAAIVVVLSGALGAVIGAVVPRRLSRLERASVLPEELGALPREIDEKIFATLSGKSELLKTIFLEALRPYRRSPFGPVVLVASARSLREEERALRARIDLLTGGKKGEALAGLDQLVRLVVEHRAVRAQRLLTWALRGWLVPHVAATAATVILLALHVLAVMR